MNLVLDIGNTSIKVGYFEDNILINKEIYSVNSINFSEIIKPDQKIIIASSGNCNEFKLKELNPSIHFLSDKSKLPIEIDYQTPETLGHDRIANAAGARFFCDAENILVIDIGTAVTYDFLNRNIFRGGNISPGLSLRYKSLHIFTFRLPMGIVPENQTITGKSSIEAVNNGVFNGLIYEINGVIEEYQQKYNKLKVIITGGDSQYFVNKLKRTTFAEPNLTLIGLNQILNLN